MLQLPGISIVKHSKKEIKKQAMDNFTFRKAAIHDAAQIQKLINAYASRNLMLMRSLSEIYETIRDFWVCEENKKIIACCALHVVGWESLSEIKSLAVSKTRHKRGIGRHLVETCLKEAKNLKVKHVFVLTNTPQFFRKLGFKRIAKAKLPHKIWTECYKCAQFPNCCEEALIKKVSKS